MKTIALNTNNMGKILTFEMKTLFEAIYAVKNPAKMYKLENLNNIEEIESYEKRIEKNGQENVLEKMKIQIITSKTKNEDINPELKHVYHEHEKYYAVVLDDIHDGGDKITTNKKNLVTEFDIAPYEDVMNDFVEHVLTQDNVTEKDIEKALTDKKTLNKWVNSFMEGGGTARSNRCMAPTQEQRTEIKNAMNLCTETESILGKKREYEVKDACNRMKQMRKITHQSATQSSTQPSIQPSIQHSIPPSSPPLINTRSCFNDENMKDVETITKDAKTIIQNAIRNAFERYSYSNMFIDDKQFIEFVNDFEIKDDEFEYIITSNVLKTGGYYQNLPPNIQNKRQDTETIYESDSNNANYFHSILAVADSCHDFNKSYKIDKENVPGQSKEDIFDFYQTYDTQFKIMFDNIYPGNIANEKILQLYNLLCLIQVQSRSPTPPNNTPVGKKSASLTRSPSDELSKKIINEALKLMTENNEIEISYRLRTGWEAHFLSRFYYSIFPMKKRDLILKLNADTNETWYLNFIAYLKENNFKSYFFDMIIASKADELPLYRWTLMTDKLKENGITENVTIAKWWDPSSGGSMTDKEINYNIESFSKVLKTDVIQSISGLEFEKIEFIDISTIDNTVIVIPTHNQEKNVPQDPPCVYWAVKEDFFVVLKFNETQKNIYIRVPTEGFTIANCHALIEYVGSNKTRYKNFVDHLKLFFLSVKRSGDHGQVMYMKYFNKNITDDSKHKSFLITGDSLCVTKALFENQPVLFVKYNSRATDNNRHVDLFFYPGVDNTIKTFIDTNLYDFFDQNSKTNYKTNYEKLLEYINAGILKISFKDELLTNDLLTNDLLTFKDVVKVDSEKQKLLQEELLEELQLIYKQICVLKNMYQPPSEIETDTNYLDNYTEFITKYAKVKQDIIKNIISEYQKNLDIAKSNDMRISTKYRPRTDNQVKVKLAFDKSMKVIREDEKLEVIFNKAVKEFLIYKEYLDRYYTYLEELLYIKESSINTTINKKINTILTNNVNVLNDAYEKIANYRTILSFLEILEEPSNLEISYIMFKNKINEINQLLPSEEENSATAGGSSQPPKQVRQLMNKFVKHVEMEHPRIMKKINETEQLSKATEKYLIKSFIKKYPTIEEKMNKLSDKMSNLLN